MVARLLRQLSLCVLIVAAASTADVFEIKAGDRVVLVGDTLFEREGISAALESRLYKRWAPRTFTVRNLSFAADRPDGVSRASFDPPEAGKKRLHEQLSLVKPTVVIIGYGMAASLEELTYKSGDPALNPDNDRYGNDFTAKRFADDLSELMNAIKKVSGDNVRFVLVAPIRHEDLRKQRPRLPDPAAHEAVLGQYRQALENVATTFGARYVDTPAVIGNKQITTNGIHPTPAGLEVWAESVAGALGWNSAGEQKLSAENTAALRSALQRRNDLFFHRWRPANYTYLFGFRKHEQGRNGAEMVELDALVTKADDVISGLVAGQTVAPIAIKPAIQPAETAAPDPGFTVGDGLQASLFAANPMISKPLHLGFDAQGRMWIASTPIYPMIEPGATASDRIFVLEDTDHDGIADRSSVFADDLLIPTGVAPVDRIDGHMACYTGASTNMILLIDTDGDGKADERRIVLSGFGTEDTHHNVHTLYWAHDGRLNFNQSVYTHTHLETPWGVVRLNAGGVFTYDTDSERVEVMIKGLWNTWGHQVNAQGQSFFTDGAGGSGITWGFPGGVFHPSEGARGTANSISPGRYPKFAGLELIDSPLFPAEWQGQAITCDFRAHRIVRMKITDLAPERSGYVTNDEPDVLRTGDAWFRPIDVKQGPDGALYVADWTNPIINHGEVDFRDERRDKERGRIWRIAPTTGKPITWTAVAGRTIHDVCAALASVNTWERDAARRVLVAHMNDEVAGVVSAWAEKSGTAAARHEAANVMRGSGRFSQSLKLLDGNDPAQRAIKARWLGDSASDHLAELKVLAADPVPRVRLEAMRALARTTSIASAEAALLAVAQIPNDDSYYAFTATNTMRSLAQPWVAAIKDGSWSITGREHVAVLGLTALPAEQAAPAVQALLSTQTSLAQEPWLTLLAHAGDKANIARLYGELPGTLDAGALRAALATCVSAAERRVAAPDNIKTLAQFIAHADKGVCTEAIRLVGLWHQASLMTVIGELAADDKLRKDVFIALERIGKPALPEIQRLLAAETNGGMRNVLLGTLAKIDGSAALAAIKPYLDAAQNENEAAGLWRVLWPANGMIDRVLEEGLPSGLSANALKGGLTTARELGRRGKKLEELFKATVPQTVEVQQTDRPANMKGWMELVKKIGDPVKGEKLYFSKGMSCTQCHAIGGVGGKLGPDMSTLGASAPLDYIIESVQNPAAKVKEGYHAVNFRLKDGSMMMGIPYNEDEKHINIRLPGLEQSVMKDAIAGRDTMGSLMPPGLIDAFPVVDQANMYAFLSQLGKPGPFDASDGRVARQWFVQDSIPSDKLAALVGKPSAFSLVDGRVVPSAWQTAISATPGDQRIYAVTVLDVGNAGVLELEIEGADRPWVDGIRLAPGIKGGPIAAGLHTICVSLSRNSLPAVLRIRSNIGRFVVP